MNKVEKDPFIILLLPASAIVLVDAPNWKNIPAQPPALSANDQVINGNTKAMIKQGRDQGAWFNSKLITVRQTPLNEQ